MSPPLKPPENKKIKVSDLSASPDREIGRRPDSPPTTRTIVFGSLVSQGSTLDSWQEEREDDGRSLSRLGTERPPLMDARDSLVINHERLVEYDPDISPYQYSMSKTGQETIHMMTRVGSGIPNLSRAGSVTDRRNLNMANANEVEARKHVGWMDTTLGLKLDPEVEDALEVARRQSVLKWNRTPSEIGLFRTNESLHLPSIPISRFSSDMSHGINTQNLLNHPSATTVTTVYSYKCDHPNKKRAGAPTAEGAVPSDVCVEDVDNIENFFNYEERIQQVPYSQVTNYPINLAEVPAFDSFQSDPGDGDMLKGFPGMVDYGGNEQNMGAQTEYQLEPKLNDTNMSLSPSVDASTDNTTKISYSFDDDDFDEELPPLYSSKPVFVDPALIQWPSKETLMATLPRKYHSFMVDTYKKDCRMWLWKSPQGRRARELLSQMEDDQEIDFDVVFKNSIGDRSNDTNAFLESDDEDSGQRNVSPTHLKPVDMTQRQVDTGLQPNKFNYFI